MDEQKWALPVEFDVGQQEIQLFVDWDTGRYVKTIHPSVARISSRDPRYDSDLDPLLAYYEHAFAAAEKLWIEKYGSPMPDHVEGQYPATTDAGAFPNECTSPYTSDEWAKVCQVCETADLTLDMLWLVVEGLGWRPGTPVAKDDPGWGVIWRKEINEAFGYIDIVYRLLGMPEELSDDERREAESRYQRMN